MKAVGEAAMGLFIKVLQNPAGLLISRTLQSATKNIPIIASRLIDYAAIITVHCYFSTQNSTQLTVLRKGDAIKCLTASIFLILDSIGCYPSRSTATRFCPVW